MAASNIIIESYICLLLSNLLSMLKDNCQSAGDFNFELVSMTTASYQTALCHGDWDLRGVLT